MRRPFLDHLLASGALILWTHALPLPILLVLTLSCGLLLIVLITFRGNLLLLNGRAHLFLVLKKFLLAVP